MEEPFLLITRILLFFFLIFNLILFSDILYRKHTKKLEKFFSGYMAIQEIRMHALTQTRNKYKYWIQGRGKFCKENTCDIFIADMNNDAVFTDIFNSFNYYGNQDGKRLNPTFLHNLTSTFWYDLRKKYNPENIVAKPFVRKNKAVAPCMCASCDKIVKAEMDKVTFFNINTKKDYHPDCWDKVEMEMAANAI